jgi:uncharacterized protein (TIGR00369 family)
MAHLVGHCNFSVAAAHFNAHQMRRFPILQCSEKPHIEELRMTNASPPLPPGAENISLGGFNRYAGPIWRIPPQGAVRRFALPVTDKHLNSAGSVHGGMLMTFADVSMSQTSRAVSGAQSCSTVSLTCDFVGPGKLGDILECRVQVTRQTRTMVFMSAEIVAGDRIVAVASGLWKIV